MTEPIVELRVKAALDPEADAAEIEERTLQLREELLQLDVEDVQQPSTAPAPEGTRAVDAAVLGTLVVTVAREAVGAVIRTVGAWLSRGGSRSVKMQLGDDSIELTDISSEEQRRALEAFLARHADPAT